MSDLISVSSLLKNSAQIEFANTDGTVGMYINVKAVKLEQQYNSIDAEPVKHGYWITHNKGNPFEIYGECSICGYSQSISDHLNYCPNCGAKMDGVTND